MCILPCFRISLKLVPSDAKYHQTIDLDSHDEFHWRTRCTGTMVAVNLAHMLY